MTRYTDQLNTETQLTFDPLAQRSDGNVLQFNYTHVDFSYNSFNNKLYLCLGLESFESPYNCMNFVVMFPPSPQIHIFFWLNISWETEKKSKKEVVFGDENIINV